MPSSSRPHPDALARSELVPWLVLVLAVLGAGLWAYGKWRLAHP